MDGNEDLKQTWNKRSKKWVLMDASKFGGIIEMRAEKWPGVPVINGKPAPEPSEPAEPKNEDNEPKEPTDNDAGKDKSGKDSGWFW